MARFFFHLHECNLVTRDEEGREFPSMNAAVDGARLEARGLLAAEVAGGKLCLSCHIEVEEEETGLIVPVPFLTAVEVTAGVSAGN